jgi:hypothetical protein
MKALFLLLYLGVCYLVVKMITEDELAARFSPKQRLFACGGGIGFASLFFLPYILGLVEEYQPIPTVVFCLPFLFIGSSAFFLQVFYPKKAQELTGFYIKLMAAVIGLLFLIPLLSGLWR